MDDETRDFLEKLAEEDIPILEAIDAIRQKENINLENLKALYDKEMELLEDFDAFIKKQDEE